MSAEGHSCGPETCWSCGESHGCVCGNCDATEADYYTPSVTDGQSYYVTGRAQIRRQITGEHAQDITPYSYEFDRMIEAVRAEEREKADREPSDAEVEAALDARELSVLERSGFTRYFSPTPDLSFFDEGTVADMRAALLAAQEVRRG